MVEETAGALQELVEVGKIRYLGVQVEGATPEGVL
ncbi:hypothetical protein [Saccharopolyspora shandongensis]